MPSKQSKPEIAPKVPLVTNLLLIEGISRSGKFLAGNLINGLKHIEPVQAHQIIEPIPFLEHFGLINRQAAKEMVHRSIDLYTYEMLAGRRFNFNKSDKSCIYNLPNYRQLLKRCQQKEVTQALREYHKNKAYSFFILHEIMPFIKLYFEVFPKLKVISIRRNPLDLVYSQYRRGYGSRWSKDEKFFGLTFKTAQGVVPWYAYQWPKNFYLLSEMDRVIKSILTLCQLYHQGYRKLPPKIKQKILFVSYEDILAEPERVVQKMSKFLGKKPLPQIKKILIREKLPNLKRFKQKIKRQQEIKRLASPEYYHKLMALERAYFKQ